MSVKKYLTLNGLAYFLDKIKSTVADELDGKSDVGHTHTKSDITDLPNGYVVDSTLDGTSSNAISNSAVSNALDGKANDSDVVHKTGDETSTGFKQFANIRANSIKGINLDGTTTDLNNCYSDFEPYAEYKGGNIQYYYCNADAGTANISNLPEAVAFSLISISIRIRATALYIKQILINSNDKTFTRYCHSSTWSSWVNETDSEYVHTSGNETVGGLKTFVSPVIFSNWTLWNNPNVIKGTIPQTSVNPYRLYFGSGSNYANSLFNIDTSVSNTGVQTLTFRSAENAVNGGDTRLRITYDPSLTQPRCIRFTGDCVPSADNTYECGTNSNKWKSFNGLNPGALSMPDINNRIDISSYITDLSSAGNVYTPPVDGWICIRSANATKMSVLDSVTNIGNGTTSDTATYLTVTTPVVANRKVIIRAVCTTLSSAYFIPCLGNV